MFCNQCGAKNSDTAKFCSECGAKLTPSTTANVSEVNNHFTNKLAEVKPSAVNTVESKISATPVTPSPTPVVMPKSEATPTPIATAPKAQPEISVEEKLANLSTAGMNFENRVASKDINPIQDPYWDDVKPEIDNEIYAIPKDNLIKVAFSILALFLVIAWLIFML